MFFYRALVKGFAECPDGCRQKSKRHGQMTVTAHLPSAVTGRHSPNILSLPSARPWALSKDRMFPKCYGQCTRQRWNQKIKKPKRRCCCHRCRSKQLPCAAPRPSLTAAARATAAAAGSHYELAPLPPPPFMARGHTLFHRRGLAPAVGG